MSARGVKRKRKVDTEAAPAAAAAAASSAAPKPVRPRAVAAAVQAAFAGHQVRANRAAKRRKKDRDAKAAAKRKQQRRRVSLESLRTMCLAAAEGASHGAVRAAYSGASQALDDALTNRSRSAPAAAAAAAGDVSTDSDSSSDCSVAATGDSESEADADGDDSDADVSRPAAAALIKSSTPADGMSLKDRIRLLSPFGKSKRWTADMKSLLLLVAYHHMHGRLALADFTGRNLKPSVGAAAAAAEFVGANASRVAEVLREYAPDGLDFDSPHTPFDDADAEERKARADVQEITAAQVDAARTHVKQRADGGSTTTWRQLHEHLTTTAGLDMSQRIMTERLMEHGFGVVPVRSAPVVDLNTDYWHRQRERYVIEYAAAKEEEKAGTAVMVFVDQSFVNLRHRRHCTVADLSADYVVQPHRSGPKAVVRSGIGRGKLYIICHAITKDGLLARVCDDGSLDRPKHAADGSAVSAELIYESGVSSDDYHTHFDNETMLMWVGRQLLPAFVARYGVDKKMILVLDNSGNHSAMRTDYVRASNRKGLLYKVLTENGVNQITVTRKMDHGKARRAVCSTFTTFQRVLDSDQWMAIAPDGAYAHELTAAVCELYKRQPRLTWSRLEVLIDAGVSSAQHHALHRLCLI